jgi:hypothetical protein
MTTRYSHLAPQAPAEQRREFRSSAAAGGPAHNAGMAEENPIRWTRDLVAAAWIGARLDRSSGRVTALVPAGYEAYARIIHPPATFAIRSAGRPYCR